MGASKRSLRKLSGDLLRSRDPCAQNGESIRCRFIFGSSRPMGWRQPHHLMILHEMFLHAASEGQKEAEWVVCWGHWWHMPQLDPEVGIPTIQLVHPETGREEFLDLYLEVYKLHRLPGSSPGELTILQEVSSAILCCSREEEKTPDAQRQPSPKDFHLPQSRQPHQERESSLDRSLARVHKAHWKALSTAATLEEAIQKLHQMKVCYGLEWRPRGRDCWRLEERRKKRCCQVSFTSQPTPSWSTNPDMPLGKMGSKDRDSDLGEPPKLKVEVVSFLQGSSKTLEGKDEDATRAIHVKVCQLGMMEGQEVWHSQLVGGIIIRSGGRLAWEVRASFQLPRHMHELDPREAPFHVPPSPPCLHQQRFMPPAISIFASQDIREIPREKAVAYARALQYFAEQNNLPKSDEPCLLAESIIELRREVRFYLSFMKEEIFWEVDLPKEEESSPPVPTTTDVAATTDIPGTTAAPEAPPVPKAAPKYARWETVLHLSQPVLAIVEIPQPTTMLRLKRRALQLPKLLL